VPRSWTRFTTIRSAEDSAAEMKTGLTVILANGDFPKRGGPARTILGNAVRVIACDGAAKAFHRAFGRWPDFTVGDFDSCRGRVGGEVVRVAEQDDNDLAKAIAFCRGRGWTKPVIVGATGKREDHTLGNVFRAMAEGLEVVTDRGRFIPFDSSLTLVTGPGTAISVFATDPATRMTSKGLEWPLDGVRFGNLYCATLNRASGRSVTINTSAPAFVFVRTT